MARDQAQQEVPQDQVIQDGIVQELEHVQSPASVWLPQREPPDTVRTIVLSNLCGNDLAWSPFVALMLHDQQDAIARAQRKSQIVVKHLAEWCSL